MPEYTYKCTCGHKFDRIFSMADMKPKARCPECRKMAPRAIVAPPNFRVSQRYGSPRTGRGMSKR